MAITKWNKGLAESINVDAVKELLNLFDTVECLPDEGESMVFRVTGENIPTDNTELYTLYEKA